MPAVLARHSRGADRGAIRGAQRITAIRFDPPEQPLDAAELHHLLPLEINRPLRMADVREAIERLFATGRYADIQVDAERSAGGVALVFVTKRSWFIGMVGAAGRISSPPDAGQLENVARPRPG